MYKKKDTLQGVFFFVHIICIIQKNVLILQKIIIIQFFLL